MKKIIKVSAIVALLSIIAYVAETVYFCISKGILHPITLTEKLFDIGTSIAVLPFLFLNFFRRLKK